MPFKSFAIRFGLRTPIITGRRLTLDALLAARLAADGMDFAAAADAVPLATALGVRRGSAVLLEDVLSVGSITFTRALKVAIDLSPEKIRHDKRDGSYNQVDVASGRFKNDQTAYQTQRAAAAWFSGHGDIDAVREMLTLIPAIGTKRTAGFGEVSSVDIEEIDDAGAGTWFSDGSPARPIPLSEWGDADAPTGYEAIRAPYWKSTPTLCALPAHRGGDGDFVRNLVGLA